ncbi:3-oxoacyl-[acyl-carrier-protein] synthase 3 protein 2 [Vibrio zhanjiangensis]|uniref:Beta-ketoacyl-[acyl-carrier-protein] synthase III n=1 Tax=Vibrio zhanjiangensis TaxID=1046128 RepID=A0ABQ6F4U3_9VIBR|nr:ketoacyl-ACP synthase III [Vibrio zhanjiangensis]GLT19890.1 3-oxoacyl-[acyl-carrier-protein] synthase 3 protein 2 [Vibrio zhanjiangensis]
MTTTYAEITGWGKCLPPTILSNQDLGSFIDTSDEWIKARTGIENRRISHVDTSELATVAAKHAIACAGLQVSDIDLLIIATCSPDSLIPNMSSKVSQNLGMEGTMAFDLNAACTGFLYSLETATRMMQSGSYCHALVIGAERLSFFIDWSMRETAVLFGDGAGAVVLSQSEAKVGLQSAQLGCDSQGRDILSVPKFGSSMNRFAADNGYWEFNFVGKEIFKRAVKGMGAAAQTVLASSQLSTQDIDVVIPHQANLRIIHTLCDLSDIDRSKAFVNINKYGNTSAATIPIALCEALEQGRVKSGDDILFAAFGAGLTWGAVHLKWGERVTPIDTSHSALPECKKSALELIDEAVQFCKKHSKF